MKSCPAIHQHTRPHPKRGVYLPYFPTFQKLPHLQRKKNKKLSQLNLPFFVLLTPFTDGPFESQKTGEIPGEWGTERCSVIYGTAGCREIGHLSVAVQSIGCSHSGSRARCCGAQCPGKASILRGNSIGVSSFWEYKGWCVRTNTLVSIFTWVIPCCMFSSSSPTIHLWASAADLQCPTGHI